MGSVWPTFEPARSLPEAAIDHHQIKVEALLPECVKNRAFWPKIEVFFT
jgi:hypothetical protein